MSVESFAAPPVPPVREAARRSAGRLFGIRLPAPLRMVLRRVLFAIPLFVVVPASSFLLLSLSSADPARGYVGVEGSQAEYLKVRHQLGLDLPWYQQYWHWTEHAIRGDLGVSLSPLAAKDHPVSGLIAQRFPVTLSLVVGALLLSTVIGVGIGVLAALRGGVMAGLTDVLSLIFFSVPGFWLGALLIGLFAVAHHWFPVVGYVPLADSPTKWFRSLVLPVLALGLHSTAGLARQTREAMMDALASEHVRMARANGIPERYVVWRLGLKSALIPVVTLVGLLTVGLLSWTVFVENVFAIPGLGSLLALAAINGDFPVAVGVTTFFMVIIVAVNLVVDLTYVLLDPRVRAG